MSEPKPEWSFTNSRGRVISTNDPVTAENYRQNPHFDEVTATPVLAQVQDDGLVKPYSEWLKAALEQEVDRRNDARGDDEPVVEVADPGNKPELVAALEADDAATTPAV